jgi:nicotinate-nucleotide pyrophosphorylase (carboxylating)
MNPLELDRQILGFLAEDIGQGDRTSDAVFPEDSARLARFISRGPLVAAGMETVAARVFRTVNPETVTEFAETDGREVGAGSELLRIRGRAGDLLRGERVALNLVQRLCGIATLTRQYVDRVAGLKTRITDTRKTTPGLRMLEKYAVRVGGGLNHRFNLADGILIKDNHIVACGSITEAVRRVRNTAPHTLRIEVEAENLEQVRESLACAVDIIMLDNMTPAAMKEAVDLVNGRALVEASGGVDLETVRRIAETGVDLISVGRLTHSAPAIDISMEIF